MPDAKDNAKASGDVHPPEVEDVAQQGPRGHPETEGAFGSPKDSTPSRDLETEGAFGAGGSGDRDRENEARPGKGENQAGFLKDKEAPGKDSSGA